MRRKGSVLVTVASAAFLVTACMAEPVRAETLRIGGSGSGLGIMKKLAEVFVKSHPGAKLEVVPSLGSTGGIKALSQGVLTMAISTRPLKESEMGAGVTAWEFARSPVVFVAHVKVGQDGVTIRELERMYRGQTTAWPDGTPVRLVLRPETDTFTKIVRNLSPAVDQAVTAAMSREGMIRATTDQESARQVEKTPGALGASPLTLLLSEESRVKMLSFNGVRPSVQGIDNGTYPLYVPLYLVTKGDLHATARQFIDFIQSGNGSRILAQYGNLVVRNRKSEKR
jgi:phosphate transport system substrate-binding protein